MFSAAELQMLISGSEEGIDLADLQEVRACTSPGGRKEGGVLHVGAWARILSCRACMRPHAGPTLRTPKPTHARRPHARLPLRPQQQQHLLLQPGLACPARSALHAQHVEYAGGYHSDHPVIALLWEVLAGFTPDEQRALLRFVTACSRAPLLGFK